MNPFSLTKPEYVLERWPYGWLVCATPGVRGVPANFFETCAALFPKKAVSDLGIARHYEMAGRRSCMAIAGPVEASRWREAITQSIANLPPLQRWWHGLDVGTSSSAMFAVLCPDAALAMCAREYGDGSTPRDSDDLGRCLRLLAAFPEFRARLPDVAAAYPCSAWPKIIAQWEQLETANPDEQSALLTGLLKG